MKISPKEDFGANVLKTKPTSNDAMLFVNCGDWKRGRNDFKKKQITVAVRFSISRHTGSMRLDFVEQLTQLASVCDLPAISKPLLFTPNKYFFKKSTSTLSECGTTLVLLTSVQSNTWLQCSDIWWKTVICVWYIDPIHKWRLFSFCSVTVQISPPTKPHLRARILFNLAHDKEAW